MAVSNEYSGLKMESPLTKEFVVSWQSPSNIALVKYWGKIGNQLPVNPSLSLSLSEAKTITTLAAMPREIEGEINLELFFDGKPEPAFQARMSKFLQNITDIFPFLQQVNLKIDTHNTFPHSAGIASSASAFSALSLCLCSLEAELCGLLLSEFEFRSKASYVARLGSGSACRSLFPAYTLWGYAKAMPGSSNFLAVQVTEVHPDFYTLRDAIIIVHDKEKKVSSSEGHKRMIGHPFEKARIKQANENISNLLAAMQSGDRKKFIQIVENEALTLHALMMTSENGFMLMYPETIQIISRIQELREETGIDMCFTLDAGPNIHLLFFNSDFEQIQKLIVEDLLKNTKQKVVINDFCGLGPEKLK